MSLLSRLGESQSLFSGRKFNVQREINVEDEYQSQKSKFSRDHYTSTQNIDSSSLSDAISLVSSGANVNSNQQFSLSPLDLDCFVNGIQVRDGVIFVSTDSSLVIFQNESFEYEYQFQDYDRISNVFIDARAYHAIVSMSDGKNWYINLNTRKRIEINEKIKITSVCWNQDELDQSSTKSVLLGTENACIYELEVKNLKVLKCTLLFDFEETTKVVSPITGLERISKFEDAIQFISYDSFKEQLHYHHLSFIQLAEYYLEHALGASIETILYYINQDNNLFFDSFEVLKLEVKKRRGDIFSKVDEDLLKHFWNGEMSLFSVLGWIDKEFLFHIIDYEKKEVSYRDKGLSFIKFQRELQNRLLNMLEASIYYKIYTIHNLPLSQMKNYIQNDMSIYDSRIEFKKNLKNRMEKFVDFDFIEENLDFFFGIHFAQKVPLCIISSMIYLHSIKVKSKPNLKSDGKSVSYVILASTVNRLYQFVGGTDSFKILFDSYKKSHPLTYLEHNSRSSHANSQLSLFSYRSHDSESLEYDAFVWLNNAGVHHGTLDFMNLKNGISDFQNTELIAYEPSMPDAISAIATQYHIFVLFGDRLKVYLFPPELCLATRENRSENGYRRIPFGEVKLVYEEIFPRDAGRGLGLSIDPILFEPYVFTDKQVYRIGIENEEYNAWRLYAENAFMSDQFNVKYYDIAMRIVDGKPELKNILLETKADYFFNKKYYMEAAIEFSNTCINFEDVVIRFYSVGKKDALQTYLLKRLNQVENMHSSGARNLQLSSLCLWLVDLYLSRINKLQCIGAKVDEQFILREFHHFLRVYHPYLNTDTTFNLISSFGFTEEIIRFSKITGDYNRAIISFITESRYKKALQILDKYCNSNHAALFYRYTPILIEYVPIETIEMLKGKVDILDAEKLIPAIMRHLKTLESNPSHSKEIISYLNTIVAKKNYTSIHNLLLYLYAKNDDKKLLKIFDSGDDVYYDPKFALRVCMKYKRYTACVKLFSQMGMHSEAVDLALNIGLNNIELVAEAANKPESEDLKKRLWLNVAQKYIESDTGNAVTLLKFTDALKIEDLLHFFSDHSKIDSFNETLNESLERYKSDIDELQHDISETIEISNQMKNEVKSLSYRYGILSSNSACDGCKNPLFSREFYLFPCNHKFHTSCIESKSLPEQVECPLCSVNMILKIHDLFTDDTDEDKLWSISR